MEDPAKRKGKSRQTILSYAPDKQEKFNKAMIMYTHAFNSTKNKSADSKEQKDEKLQTAFLADLSNYCNVKDQSYAADHQHFSDCFKALDEG